MNGVRDDSLAITGASLTRDLASGRVDTAGALFRANKARSPVVVWSPADFDLTHPVLAGFASTCDAAADGLGRLDRAAFGGMNLSAYDRWIMLVERQPDGSFTYLRYGAEIAAHYGRDMTGSSTRDFPGHIGMFFAALYEAARLRGERVFSVHEPPSLVFVREWRRLIVPIFEADGECRLLVAVNVPDNELRAGLEAVPDPVLVVQADGWVAFANAAAEALFGPSPFTRQSVSFAEYTGLNVDFIAGGDPRRGSFLETRHVGALEELIVHFTVTQSIVHHRGQRLHVVVAKPD